MNALYSFFNDLMRHSLIRFGMVGAVSTFFDLVVLKLLLMAGVNVYLATAIGFLVGLTNGYFMNTKLVFKQNRDIGRYAKYFLISLGGLLITEQIIHYLHVREGLEVLPSKLVAVVIVFFWNYILSKLWAFK